MCGFPINLSPDVHSWGKKAPLCHHRRCWLSLLIDQVVSPGRWCPDLSPRCRTPRGRSRRMAFTLKRHLNRVLAQDLSGQSDVLYGSGNSSENSLKPRCREQHRVNIFSAFSVYLRRNIFNVEFGTIGSYVTFWEFFFLLVQAFQTVLFAWCTCGRWRVS